MRQYAGEVQKITNIAMQRNYLIPVIINSQSKLCTIRKRVQDLYVSMWIYKAISDFGPIQFKDVKKLSHSLFYIKLNKEGGETSQRLFFSAKASMENMRKLVYSTLKAVEWEFKQHTITIYYIYWWQFNWFENKNKHD